MHSVYSDGILTPEAMFKIAKKRKVSVISITDHDTIDHIPVCLEIEKKYDVGFVPGIEISAYWKDRDIHILGYFIDHNNSYIQKYCKRFKKERFRRAERILKNLAKDGYELDIEKIKAKSITGNIGRPMLAEALVEGGYAYNSYDAFSRFLGDDSKYSEKKYQITPKKAVEVIHKAGGLAVLAHPVYYFSHYGIIEEIISAKIDGIEVIHSMHSNDDVRNFTKLADEKYLLKTGGSDCHGGRKNGRILVGKCNVPYKFYEELKERLAYVR